MQKRKIILGAVTLAFVVGLIVVPRISRWVRVRGYAKEAGASPGAVPPMLVDRLIELDHRKKWQEAVELSDILGPRVNESPEILLYSARAYLELGDVERARQNVRQAKMSFRRQPQERIRLETRDPDLFWKIGYLLREPGA